MSTQTAARPVVAEKSVRRQLGSRKLGGRVSTSGWIPGLDGLRGLAVAAVVVYHVLPGRMTGGFLGVDVFFAISGYLITRLLLVEIAETGRVAVLSFWMRRWRRLVPAVLALLVVLSLGGATVWRDQLPYLRSGVLASIGYCTNWWLIFAHHDYFVTANRPPMIQHLWSLAIEEQFYLVWPLVLAGVVGTALALRRRTDATGRGWLTGDALMRVIIVCVLLAASSSLAMTVISVRSDVPLGADASRVYYGTDTHSTGLLLGAAFGALSMLGYGRPAQAWRGRAWRAIWTTLGDAVAIGAIGFLGYQAVSGSQFDPQLYRSGFAECAVAAAVGVACVARRGSRVALLLELRPLRWLGRRSYSIYLWYWPVVVATRPDLDVSGPRWLLEVNQLVIIVVLGAASYRFVEQPFRTGAARRWLSGLPAHPKRPAPIRAPRRVQHLVVASLSAAVIAALLAATQDGHVAQASGAPPTTGPRTIAYVPVQPSTSMNTPTPTAPGPRHPAQPPAKRRVRPAQPPLTEVPISAFGDSVMLGAAPALIRALPRASVFAVEGRQARAVFADISARRTRLGQVVVIHTGDNGVIGRDDLRAMLRTLHAARRVVLINDHVPREWEMPNNATLGVVAKEFGNVRLVDWHHVSGQHPKWFWNDGIHLRADGAAAYATLIKAAIEGR